MSAGVCTSALRIRLPSTWRSWCGSPCTTACSLAADRDVAAGIDRACVRRRVAGELGHIDVLAHEVVEFVQPREREQVLDQHAHARRLALDAAHRLLGVRFIAGGAGAEQLRIAADRGKRRPQLVRGVGEEAAQAALARLALRKRLLEPVEHRVEGDARGARPPSTESRARLGATGRPPAIAPAVSPMRSSGRRPTRTISQLSSARASSTPPITSASTRSSRSRVRSTSVIGMAAIVVPGWSPVSCATARYSTSPPAVESTVMTDPAVRSAGISGAGRRASARRRRRRCRAPCRSRRAAARRCRAEG